MNRREIEKSLYIYDNILNNVKAEDEGVISFIFFLIDTSMQILHISSKGMQYLRAVFS